MAQNILGYVQSEFRTFSEYPFNSVDSLCLSQLSYIHYNNVVPRPGESDAVRPVDLLRAENFGAMFNDMVNANATRDLLFSICASPRFRNMRLSNYVEHSDSNVEKQFAAVTFLPDDGTAYIAYRGTDVTLVGWKEDFNMAFVSPVPSQLDGMNYFNMAASILGNRPLRIGGHSKGGNVAVYSVLNGNRAFLPRVERIYSHDGPGFLEDIIDSDSFDTVEPLIDKTLPQFSVIGMLLQTQENYRIVNSSEKWILQHDPFSWCVTDSEFDYLDSITVGARFTDRTLNEWIHKMTREQRAMFVDTIYRIVSATGVRTFTDIAKQWRVFFPIMFKEIKNIPPDDKRAFRQLVKLISDVAAKNLKLIRTGDDRTDVESQD